MNPHFKYAQMDAILAYGKDLDSMKTNSNPNSYGIIQFSSMSHILFEGLNILEQIAYKE